MQSNKKKRREEQEIVSKACLKNITTPDKRIDR
jgi:hypothetical protein